MQKKSKTNLKNEIPNSNLKTNFNLEFGILKNWNFIKKI
ncbi:hypothetical protein FEM21_15420 [Flavobacterium seoulense]|uniref:Uncharacterized protein n=1 Tax=Flavobacterium seoulense TaxID=1492738 RepID=A0A066WXP1_9FLAO|nr:hypothetical protein FEM21_15420 [Flavobacterium seoulense]